MLREFAVDPKVLRTWPEFRLWWERFDLLRARVIARYPENWTNLLLNEISQESPLNRKRIKRCLEKSKRKLFDTSRSYNGDLDWIDNAMYEHVNREPFHAVISLEPDSKHPGMLYADEVEEDSPELEVPTGLLIARTAEAMADSIDVFLKTVRRLKFVDPYFNPSLPRYRNPLREFLSKVDLIKCTGPIEYHLKHNGSTAADFSAKCLKSIPSQIPEGLEVTFCRWEEIANSESIHPRYVMDDRMGFRFEHGLDEETEKQTTDVEIISEVIRKERWRDFAMGGDSPYRLIDSVKILGTRKRR